MDGTSSGFSKERVFWCHSICSGWFLNSIAPGAIMIDKSNAAIAPDCLFFLWFLLVCCVSSFFSLCCFSSAVFSVFVWSSMVHLWIYNNVRNNRLYIIREFRCTYVKARKSRLLWGFRGVLRFCWYLRNIKRSLIWLGWSIELINISHEPQQQ